MTAFQRRCFIALDEWLGAVLCAYLRIAHDPWATRVFVAWTLSLYVVSYPWHWFLCWQEYKTARAAKVAHVRGLP